MSRLTGSQTRPWLDRALHIFSATDEDLRGQVSVMLEGEDSPAFKLADVMVEGQGGLRALLFRGTAKPRGAC